MSDNGPLLLSAYKVVVIGYCWTCVACGATIYQPSKWACEGLGVCVRVYGRLPIQRETPRLSSRGCRRSPDEDTHLAKSRGSVVVWLSCVFPIRVLTVDYCRGKGVFEDALTALSRTAHDGAMVHPTCPLRRVSICLLAFFSNSFPDSL